MNPVTEQTPKRRRFSRFLLGLSLVVAAPLVVACGGESDPISDQINQQVEGLKDQAGQEALDQINQATGGQVEELQNQTEEALNQLDQARDQANQALNQAQQKSNQAQQALDQAGQ